jgi:hypothetical protein
MKNIENRLKKLESRLITGEEQEDFTGWTDEEVGRELARLMYKDDSYGGYVFKSLEEYDGMTRIEQRQYIHEVVEVMKPWLEERR